MSEWITDRRPTKEDADKDHCVWSTYDGKVVYLLYNTIKEGEPWMPIFKPEPYVAPKRWRVSIDVGDYFIYDAKFGVHMALPLPTREAAERIAAIYNEVMP